MAKTSEEIIAGIKAAVLQLVTPQNLNVWRSVRDASITALLKTHGVDYNYSSAFIEELKTVGLIETTGQSCGRKYMVRSCVIPDADFLARKIYDNRQARLRKGKEFEGYAASRVSDLRPRSSSAAKKLQGRNGPVKVVPREIAPLGSMGFILHDNEIKEVMVIGISYDPQDRRHVVYTVEMYRKGSVPEGERDIYNVLTTPRCKFYKTITDLVQNICIQKYVKRSNK